MRVVPRNYWRGQLFIHVEPILNRLRLVILSAKQTASVISRARRAWLESLEGSLADVARCARAQTPDQLTVIRLEQKYCIHLASDRSERSSQSFGLWNSTHRAVENRAQLCFRRRNCVAQDSENHRIRHQITTVHVLLGFDAEWRAIAHSYTKKVAGRDLWNRKASRKQLALSSLPRARRSEKNDYHDRVWTLVTREGTLPTEPHTSLLHEAVVLAKEHVLIDLRHRIERNAHHDQQRRTAKDERDVDH